MNLQIDENHYDMEVWSPLFAVLKADRLSRPAFNEMLRFVNPPPKIKSTFAIFENLASVFNYYTAILNTYRGQGELVKQVANWERYCLVVVSRRNEINNSLPEMFNLGSKTDVPPFHSYYESHPLGVALWCSPSNPVELHRYRLLQAYLCLSIYRLSLLEKQNPHLHKNAKILACRAVRKLAHSEHAKILSSLPANVETLEEYRRAFIRVVKDEEFHPLIAIFNLALGLTQGKGKGKGGRKRNLNPFKKPQQTVEFGDDDEPAKREKVDVITYTKGSKTEQKARKKSLCAPNEFESAQEFLECPEPGPDPSGGLSLSQQYIRAKIAASSIALHNQRLAADWDQLTSHEIGVFLKELKRLAISDDDICGVKAQELAMFLAIVFWTSASTKTAADAVRVPAVAACEAALGICWSSEQDATWVIKPFVPRLKIVPKSILEAQALPLAVRFTIAIPTEAAAIIGRRLNRMNTSFRAVRIFHRKPAELEQAADHFFSDLRHREGGRQSLQRISGCLHSLLTRMPGSDITAAMSITGKNDPLGVVPIHYTANEIERLKKLYRCACFELANARAQEAKENSADSTEPVKAKYYVGSRFVPKEKVVTKLALDLRERIEKAREVYRDNGDPVQLHNDLTVYTTMMLGFGTGYRAVRDPLLQEAEIDRATGFGLISDKDGDDYYNARIIWLPEICLRQLDYYQSHIKHLQKWLFERNQDLFFKVRHQEVTGRYAVRQYPALFLLQRNAEDLSVHPKLLQELLQTLDYQLPMNGNRHYLRTSLIADNCPIEVIDAFLGHWERGQEPWGRYSGLSPAVYREKLALHLIPLLEKNGWRPEEGLI